MSYSSHRHNPQPKLPQRAWILLYASVGLGALNLVCGILR